MPTYEYRCNSCDHEFEEFQSITAEPIQVCPKCEEHAVQRLISAGNGLIFKGSGFYITDYKNNGTSSASSSASGSKKDNSGKAKSDSKSGDKSSDS